MDYYEYEFWQCGHITSIEDGYPVSENGNLSQPPLIYTPRDLIRRRFGDICSACHANRLIVRLRDIRTLLSECNSGNDAVQMAERRVTALNNFLSNDSRARFGTVNSQFKTFPAAFSQVEHGVAQLEFAAVDAATRDFAAAHRRLRSRITQSFVSGILAVRTDAVYQTQFRNYSEVARECLFEIIEETKVMVREIKANEEAELRYLADLDVKAAELRMLVNKYVPGAGERSGGSLGRSGSDGA